MQGRVAVNRPSHSRLIPEQAGPQELREGSGKSRSPRVRLSTPSFPAREKEEKSRSTEGKQRKGRLRGPVF